MGDNIAGMTVEAPVNVHKVDGDPRKIIAIRRLVEKYPEAIAYWHNSGIYERTVGKELGAQKHKHGVLGHQFGGTLAAEAIGSLLSQRDVLTEEQVRETALANMIHDADKTTDMQFIIMAMGGKDGKGEVSWRKVEEIVNKTDLPNKSDILEQLEKEYGQYFDTSVDVGERVHVARAMIAGRVHKERLARAGFSSRVIGIQGATEYTGCDEVDALLDAFPILSDDEKVLTIEKCIVNYVDNGMKESELVPVEDRTSAVFQKPINVALSTAYSRWNDKGETAEAKQIRVGNRVQDFLAGLAGIEPKRFLESVEEIMRSNISSV